MREWYNVLTIMYLHRYTDIHCVISGKMSRNINTYALIS